MPAHVHRLVKETAQAMAHELYDALMTRNDWYAVWKKQNPGASVKALEMRFVARNWGKCVGNARAILAGMLTGPYDETFKESVMEALELDATLIRGRIRVGEGMQIVGGQNGNARH